MPKLNSVLRNWLNPTLTMVSPIVKEIIDNIDDTVANNDEKKLNS